MSSQTHISHRFSGGQVEYTTEGITFSPVLTKHRETIPWNNILFISPTPSVKVINEKWQTYSGIHLMDSNSLENLDYFDINVAIKNRHLIRPKLSLIQSMLFNMNFPYISPIYKMDDKPDDFEGALKYGITKRTLSHPLKELLDFLKQNSQFGLLYTED